MRALEAAQLLEIRERGKGLSPVRRALLLLEAASPDTSPEQLASLPVGRRDERLLDLRARTLGPALQSETRCPSCGERLELDLRSEELRAASAGAAFPASRGPDGSEGSGASAWSGGSGVLRGSGGAGEVGGTDHSLTVRHDGYEVAFRLPTSRDLLEAGKGEGAEARLLERCVLEARSGEDPVAADALPVPVIEAVGAAMADADPLADVRLELTCPACGHGWTSPFDPVAFFWDEIEAWVPRLLREVHRLASAYGWSEREILGMSAWRRAEYLRLLEA